MRIVTAAAAPARAAQPLLLLPPGRLGQAQHISHYQIGLAYIRANQPGPTGKGQAEGQARPDPT